MDFRPTWGWGVQQESSIYTTEREGYQVHFPTNQTGHDLEIPRERYHELKLNPIRVRAVRRPEFVLITQAASGVQIKQTSTCWKVITRPFERIWPHKDIRRVLTVASKTS